MMNRLFRKSIVAAEGAATVPAPTPLSLAMFYSGNPAEAKALNTYLQTHANKLSHDPHVRAAIVSDVYLNMLANQAAYSKLLDQVALVSPLHEQQRLAENRVSKQKQRYDSRHQVVSKPKP